MAFKRATYIDLLMPGYLAMLGYENYYTTFCLGNTGRPRKLALWFGMVKCLLRLWMDKNFELLEFREKPSISYNEDSDESQIYCRVR